MKISSLVAGVLLPLAGGALASAASPAPLRAQSRMVDEGSFAVTRHGASAGRELFRIVRGPSVSGDLFRATGSVVAGDRRVVPSLSVDTAGAPVAYDVTVREGATNVVRVQARSRPGRFTALVQTPHGEAAKEYVVGNSTVLLDDDVFHQYYFVALGHRSGPVTVLDPRSDTQVAGVIEARPGERVDVGGQSIAASHYVLRVQGGAREFWLDGEGRVLRVTIPALGLVAQREEPPR